MPAAVALCCSLLLSSPALLLCVFNTPSERYSFFGTSQIFSSSFIRISLEIMILQQTFSLQQKKFHGKNWRNRDLEGLRNCGFQELRSLVVEELGLREFKKWTLGGVESSRN
jgi:hypothetical protein